MKQWHSFKAKGRAPRFAAAFDAIDDAVGRLQAQCDGGLISVVLFGSLARLSATYDDIDLLVVADRKLGPVPDLMRRMAERVFGPAFLEHGQLFSFLVYTPEQLAHLRDELPVFKAVRRDGVLIYGEDPFVAATGARISEDRKPAIGDG